MTPANSRSSAGGFCVTLLCRIPFFRILVKSGVWMLFAELPPQPIASASPSHANIRDAGSSEVSGRADAVALTLPPADMEYCRKTPFPLGKGLFAQTRVSWWESTLKVEAHSTAPLDLPPYFLDNMSTSPSSPRKRLAPSLQAMSKVEHEISLVTRQFIFY